MMKTAETVSTLLDRGEAALRHAVFSDDAVKMDPASAHLLNHAAVLLGRAEDGAGVVLVVAAGKKFLPDQFQGEMNRLAGGVIALLGKTDHANALAICRHFPWCTPVASPEKGISLEADSPEEVRPLFSAAASLDFFPVASSWDDAVFTAFSLDLHVPFGAKEALVVLAEDPPSERDAALPEPWQKTAAEYRQTNFILKQNLSLFFAPGEAELCVRRWNRAMESAKGGAAVTLAPVCGQKSLSPQEHLFCVRELRKHGVDFSCFAPASSADGKAFFRDLSKHAAIAETYGACRLQLPPFFWKAPAEAVRELPNGFSVSWNPALCADLPRFFSQIQQINLGNSTK